MCVRCSRAFVLVAVASLVLALPAWGGHGPVPPGGPYEGHATGTAVHVDGVTTATNRAADLEAGVANASVRSRGLARRLSTHRREIAPELAEKHAHARASILEAGALLAPPEARNQIAPFVAERSAPATDSGSKSVLTTRVATALHVDLLRSEAVARWNPATCVVGEPISRAEQLAARLEVLETADDPSTDAAGGFDAALVGLDARRAGPSRAATHAIAAEQLYASGDTFGLQSATTSTLVPVTFFEGTPNEFTVEIDGPSSLAARANGRSGGAAIVFSVPLVSVIQAGTARTVVPGSPITIAVPSSGDALARIEVGVLQSQTRAPNGTQASAVANVVEVTILDAANPSFRGATVALGHLEASSTVPAGGISCPIPVTKVADPPSVPVGDTFDTTITVTNPYGCPLANVRLEDEITVDGAARFEVVGAPGAASSSGGAQRSTGNAAWNLGTIAPKASKSVVITLEAQGGAGRIADTATATGTLTNCEARPAEGGADVTAMTRVTVPVSGNVSITEPVTGTTRVLSSSPTGRLPKTGLADTVPLGVALLGAGAGLSATLRRRVR